MSSTSLPHFLIEGRDYSWTPSMREGFHSFCHLTRGDAEGSRIAALQHHPRGWGYRLIWGPDDAGFSSGDWQSEEFRYVLDARDTIARRIQRYVLLQRHLLLPA